MDRHVIPRPYHHHHQHTNTPHTHHHHHPPTHPPTPPSPPPSLLLPLPPAHPPPHPSPPPPLPHTHTTTTTTHFRNEANCDPATRFNATKHPPSPAQVQAHFISSGTRPAQEKLDHCAERAFRQTTKGPRSMHSGTHAVHLQAGCSVTIFVPAHLGRARGLLHGWVGGWWLSLDEEEQPDPLFSLKMKKSEWPWVEKGDKPSLTVSPCWKRLQS